MARPRKGLLVGACILVLVAAGLAMLLLFRNPRPKRDLDRGLRVDSVAVDCPAMRLGIRELRVVPQKGFTGWGYHLICAEPKGCDARVQLIFHYLAAGTPGDVSTTRFIKLVRGQTFHDGFLQRPAVVVDRITKVEAKLLTPNGQGAVATPLPW